MTIAGILGVVSALVGAAATIVGMIEEKKHS